MQNGIDKNSMIPQNWKKTDISSLNSITLKKNSTKQDLLLSIQKLIQIAVLTIYNQTDKISKIIDLIMLRFRGALIDQNIEEDLIEEIFIKIQQQLNQFLNKTEITNIDDNREIKKSFISEIDNIVNEISSQKNNNQQKIKNDNKDNQQKINTKQVTNFIKTTSILKSFYFHVPNIIKGLNINIQNLEEKTITQKIKNKEQKNTNQIKNILDVKISKKTKNLLSNQIKYINKISSHGSLIILTNIKDTFTYINNKNKNLIYSCKDTLKYTKEYINIITKQSKKEPSFFEKQIRKFAKKLIEQQFSKKKSKNKKMKKFSFFSKFFEKLKNIGKIVKDAVMKKMGPVFEYIKNTLKGIWRITKTIYKLVKKFIISPIITAIKSVANIIRSAIGFFFKMLGNLSRLIFNAIRSNFRRIGDFLKNAAHRLNDFLRKKCKWYDKAINKINNVKNFIKSKLQKFSDKIKNFKNGLKKLNPFNGLKDKLKNKIDDIGRAIKNSIDKIKGKIRQGLTKIGGKIKDIAKFGKKLFGKVLGKVFGKKLGKTAAKKAGKKALVKFLTKIIQKIIPKIVKKIATIAAGAVIPGPGWVWAAINAILMIVDFFLLFKDIYYFCKENPEVVDMIKDWICKHILNDKLKAFFEKGKKLLKTLGKALFAMVCPIGFLVSRVISKVANKNANSLQLAGEAKISKLKNELITATSKKFEIMRIFDRFEFIKNTFTKNISKIEEYYKNIDKIIKDIQAELNSIFYVSTKKIKSLIESKYFNIEQIVRILSSIGMVSFNKEDFDEFKKELELKSEYIEQYKKSLVENEIDLNELQKILNYNHQRNIKFKEKLNDFIEKIKYDYSNASMRVATI